MIWNMYASRLLWVTGFSMCCALGVATGCGDDDDGGKTATGGTGGGATGGSGGTPGSGGATGGVGNFGGLNQGGGSSSSSDDGGCGCAVPGSERDRPGAWLLGLLGLGLIAARRGARRHLG